MRTAFNPCGMVWTYLRSCYTFPMRVFVGGQEVLLPARWYFCADGAKPFPFAHGGEASPWLKTSMGEVNAAWGEVTPYPTDPNANFSRGLDRGLNPGYRGQCYIGDPQWFIDGQLPAGILTQPPPPMAGCCQAPPAASSGAIVLAGFSSAYHGIAGCPQCPGGAPFTWTLTITGGTGDFVQFNGTYSLTHQTGCAWNHIVGLRVWSLSFLFSTWQVRVNNTATHVNATWTVQGVFSCLGPNLTWSLLGSSGSGTPGTVSASPA